MASEIEISIHERYKGQVTPIDLIQSTGSLVDWLTGPSSSGIFQVRCGGYLLEAGVTNDVLYIQRNNATSVAPLANEAPPTMIIVQWSPDRIVATALGSGFEKEKREAKDEDQETELVRERTFITDTPTTYPPFELINWARENGIAPASSYKTASDLFEVVVSAIQGIQDKVDKSGAQGAFWNVAKEVENVASRLPKQEPEIQKLLDALLSDAAVAKSLEISREYPTGGGSLDFLFTGSLMAGGLSNVCVELKNAHSSDLVRGLTIQLPTYMKSKGCNQGVYVVLDYRPDFEFPKSLSLDGLDLYLQEKALEAGIQGIRIVILRLSSRDTPSQAKEIL